MRKVIAAAFVALVAVGLGGYFAVTYWARHAVTREVDAVLDRWRSGGGTATRGPVDFDLWTRTVKVADVVLTSRTSPDDKLSVAQVVAVGADRSGGATRLDLFNLEIGGTLSGVMQARMQQKAPRVTFTRFSARPSAPAAGASPFDATRIWLEQFSTITAETVEVPSCTVAVVPAVAGARPDAPAAAEYAYRNLVLHGVADGRIAEATVDGIAVHGNTGRGNQEFTGELANISVGGIDVAPLLAFLDPSRPGREGYHRVYRELSAGPYTLRFADGGGLSVERLAAEDIGLYPSKLSLDDLVFLAEVGGPAGKPPTLTQVGMLTEKMAGLYEGVHLGKLEFRDARLSAMQDSISVARVAVEGLDSGRLAEFSVEGLVGGQSPARAPLSIGGLTVRGFQIANLFRTASRVVTSPERAAQGPPAVPAQILELLALLDGIELKEIAVAEPTTQRVVHLEALNASWGPFVGDIPTQVRLSAKVRAPVGAAETEPMLKALAARGIPTMTASLDLGASWSEAAQKVAVTPATLEIGDLLVLSLKASAGNIAREAFSPDAAKALASAALAEAGPIELTLRDLGALDLAAAELARAKGEGPEAGRALLAESFAQKAAELAQANPGARAFFDAVSQFVRTKGETLTITLTPKGRVGVLQAVESAWHDPVAGLLANFDVEARAGRP